MKSRGVMCYSTDVIATINLRTRRFLTDMIRFCAPSLGVCCVWCGVILVLAGCAGGGSRKELEKEHERFRNLGGRGSTTVSRVTGGGGGGGAGADEVVKGDGGVGGGGRGVREMLAQSIYSPLHGERLYVEAVTSSVAKPSIEQRRIWKAVDGNANMFSLEISQPRRIGETPQEWKPARTLTFAYEESEEVVLRTLVDHEKMTLTRFEPPLVMLPERMLVGETHQASTSLEVLDLKRDSRVIDRGTAAILCTLTIGTSLSEGVPSENLLLQTSMTFDIGPATVLQERGQTIKPQTGGLIGEVERLRVKVGIITIRRDEKSWMLAQ